MTVAETLALDGALEGVELTDVDLANVDASRARMADVTIEGGRLTGLLWTEGVVRDCVLRRCRANLAGFAAARLSAVRFEACDLRESDFSDAALREVVFDGCDLRGCRLDGVRLGTELKGLGLPYGDLIEAAGTLAGALGIEVLET
jgi:uncharacterized protein YjbI with pentapeptide repeats